MKKVVRKATLEILQADLTRQAVDAIVNAANIHLQHGGGVAAAIARRGGSLIQKESDRLMAQRGAPLRIGEAVLTGAGLLPAKHVIHATGPVWGQQSEAESDKLLCTAIRNSLKLADEHQLTSIAFPAISTGIYHFPLARAAKLMIEEASDYLEGPTGLRRVVFCLFDDPSYQAFVSALATM